MAHDLRLLVNGQQYGGWTEIDAQIGVQTLANTFRLQAQTFWPQQATPRPIQPGSACTLMIDNTTIITGWTDELEPDYSAQTDTTTVTGRDATGDLVDCSAIVSSGQFTGQTLLQIAQKLCKPFGIKVTARSSTPVVSPFRIHIGETVQEALERAARQAGMLLMSDGRGQLVIGQASSSRASTAIVLGKNIVAASGSRSMKARYSLYRIVGQAPLDDDDDAEATSQVMASATDAGVSRYRPLVLVAEDNATQQSAQQRALWERNTRRGRALEVTYTLKGWYQDNGALWAPDCIVTVNDSKLGIAGDLYISRVAYKLNAERGTHVLITVTPKETFSTYAAPPTGKDSGDADL